MGGGTTTSTTTQTEDPQIVSRKLDAYDTAKARSENLMKPYSGQRVAAFDPEQIGAQSDFLGIASSNPGADSLGRAKSIFGDLSGYKPSQVRPGTATAISVDPTLLKGVDVKSYMNPYEDEVVSRTLADIARQRDIQRVKDSQYATMSKAFGDTRHGVADSLTNEAYDRNMLDTAASLRSSGFDRAMGYASGDVDRQNQAGVFNATNRMDTERFNISNDYDAQNRNVANDMAGAQFRAGMARELTGLSDLELQRALATVGIRAAVGDTRQAMEQARLDAAMAQYEEERMQPVTQQGILSSALSGLPTMMSSTTTEKKSVNPLAAALGTIFGGLQTANKMGAFGS